MLVESIRTFGGALSNIDIVAVKPRLGPQISSTTKAQFKRFGVEFIDLRLNTKFAWWNNANKSFVMALLEDRVSTPNITWMDGDLIVLCPLQKLLPGDGTQF